MTLFEKIVLGEIPAYKIAETDNCLAFLDAFPLKEGHVLVIPKKPINYIFDLNDDMTISLHLFTKKVAQAMKEVIDCNRIGMAVIGLEVPHTHIHLVPLDQIDDINFSKSKIKLSDERMQEIAGSIQRVFTSLHS